MNHTDDNYVWEWIDGVSLSCLTTGQVWDASHWTRADWEDFMEPGHDRVAQAEMMIEYPTWEALRDRVPASDRNECAYCHRAIIRRDGQWIDPQATGDDVLWREVCNSHDTFPAEHEPGMAAGVTL